MALPGEPITEIPGGEEAPAEEVVTEEVEGQEYDETNPEGASDSTDGTEAPEAPADPFAEYGGADAVRQAHQLRQMLNSRDGIQRLYDEAARALGIQAQQAAAPEAPAAPQYDDDDLMTFAQVKQLLQEQVLQPWQQTEAQRTEQAARQVVASAKKDLGIEDDETWAAVLQLGDRYLGDDMSPESVANAVRRGHADFEALVRKNGTERVAQKAAVKKIVPKAPAGGGTAAPAPQAEPQTIEEAIARARKRLLGD